MPRPNPGPRLVVVRDPRWTRAKFYIRWTEQGQKRERATPFDAADPGRAQEYFETGSTSAAEPREPAHVIPIKSGSPTS